MGLISIDEFHDKLSTFLIDFIGNTINKEIFGYLNIESLSRQLVNITTLSSNLEKYRDLTDKEKEEQLTKEISLSNLRILERLEECFEYYKSKFQASEQSANQLPPESINENKRIAMDIPKLRESIEFLFGEGTIIFQERIKRQNDDKSKLDTGSTNQNYPIDEPQDLLDSKDKALKQYILFKNWIEFESTVKHLMQLININVRTYYNAKEQYAMWTSTLAPPIVIHTLEQSESTILDTINRLIEVLMKIFNKKILIRNV